MPNRQLKGTIISNKIDNTVVVKTERVEMNPKMKKRYRISNRYKAHAIGEFAIGDKVVIEECKPMSKDKKWKVVTKI